MPDSQGAAWRGSARTTGPGGLPSGSSQLLIIRASSHGLTLTLTPTHDIACQGLSKGLWDHRPVPPAIMPTDFTVLMTGLDFLSGRMANFPAERREKGKPQLSNMPRLGPDRMGAKPAERSRRMSLSLPPQTVEG